MNTIMIVYGGPDRSVLQGLRPHLRSPLYTLVHVQGTTSLGETLITYNPHVLLLEGEYACNHCLFVREQWPYLPLLILSEEGSDHSTVHFLDGGADDVYLKPFPFQGEELAARIRAQLRRAKHGRQSEPVSVVLESHDGFIALCPQSFTVQVYGKQIHLTRTEFTLLHTLMRADGEVVSHQHLLEKGWGQAYCNQRNYLHIYMRRLRQKIESSPTQPQYILNHVRAGYAFHVGVKRITSDGQQRENMNS